MALAVMFCSVYTQAQPLQKAVVVNRSITPSVGQVWWGYFKGPETLQGMGTSFPETYDCAIFIPGNLATTQGCTINGIRFGFDDVKNIRNVKVWMTTELPTTGNNFNIIYQKVDKVVDRNSSFNEVTFDKPYTITSKGVYVGYSFDILDATTNADQNPMIITKAGAVKDALTFRASVSSPEWIDLSTSGYGNLALQVVLSGGVASHNTVALSKIQENVSVADSICKLPLILTNNGSSVHSIDYSLTMEGKSADYHLDLPSPISSLGETAKLYVNYKAPSKAELTDVDFKLTKVNGVQNENQKENQSSFSLANLKKSALRKSVIENYTANWGGWCPSGIVGMRLLQKEFGDKVIVIGVHGGDMMEASSYSPILESLKSGYPSCIIDRYHTTDPYSGDSNGNADGTITFKSDSIFRFINARPSEGTIKLKAAWTDATRKKFNVTSTVNFGYNRSDNPYTIAYVLLEDSVHGEGEEWIQVNQYPNYAKQYVSDDMKEFTQGELFIKGLQNMNVALGIWDAYGIKGSLTGSIERGKDYTHNYSIESFNFQNKDRLRLVAMLINTKNNAIVNAEMIKLTEITGLSNTTSGQTLEATVVPTNNTLRVSVNVPGMVEAGIYTTDGKLLSKTSFERSTEIATTGLKGVYLIRVTNAKSVSVRKVTI